MADTDLFTPYRRLVAVEPHVTDEHQPLLNDRGRSVVWSTLKIVGKVVSGAVFFLIGMIVAVVLGLSLGLEPAMTHWEESTILPCPNASSMGEGAVPCVYDGPRRDGTELTYMLVPTIDGGTAVLDLETWSRR